MAKKKAKQHGGSRDGAGRRPLDGGAVTIAVTIPRPMVEQLDTIAKKQEWTRSQTVREAIQLLLNAQ